MCFLLLDRLRSPRTLLFGSAGSAAAMAALAHGGAPFRLGSDARERLRHGALPGPRDELAPPAANAPQVGAQLAPVLELRPAIHLSQFEGLEHVRDRAAHEPKGDALRSLESNRLHGRSGQTAAEGREVLREDHVGAA